MKEIDIEVGQLMQVDRRVLKDALTILITGPILKGAKIHLRVARARFSCRRCGHRWTMNEAKKQLSSISDKLLVREPDSRELPLHFLPYLYPAFLHCSRCGSSDVEVPEGEEIILRRLVMG